MKIVFISALSMYSRTGEGAAVGILAAYSLYIHTCHNQGAGQAKQQGLNACPDKLRLAFSDACLNALHIIGLGRERHTYAVTKTKSSRQVYQWAVIVYLHIILLYLWRFPSSHLSLR